VWLGDNEKKNSYFQRKYLSILARRGRKKAVIAVAHKMIIAVYHVLKDRVAYREPLPIINEQHTKKQIAKHLAKLKELGHPLQFA